jgi:UDP-N-acetylmuramyl pentapeptide phosphotransferase/UDP-N-acetylglucosamine-1-phosphate transferase
LARPTSEHLVLLITFLWIVWVINAYNFMDGIDGIAGVQALATSAGWLIIGLLYDNFAFALYSTAVLGASLGFLIHNWDPAKVFMGDVGSAFSGVYVRRFSVFGL